ncbi:MAG: DUF3261 domain-containing protein [Thermodesulfobacteriota bacterium]
MKKYFLLFALILISGCTAAVPEHNADLPEELSFGRTCREIREYNSNIAKEIEFVNSVRFSFRGESFAAVGPVRLNEEENSFSMAAVSPMGMTLFQIEVKNGELANSSMIPAFKRFKQAADAVAEDIRRIYFNRDVDTQKAVLKNEPGAVILEIRKDGMGKYEYRFSSTPLVLISKTYYEKGRKVWSAHYYNYTGRGKRIFPLKTFLKHYRNKYALTVETKRIKE